MLNKIMNWFPLGYLVITALWNLYLLKITEPYRIEYLDAEDTIFGIIIAAFIVFIPAIILSLIFIKNQQNLKYSMFASMWLWAISSYLFYGALQADRPCMAG